MVPTLTRGSKHPRLLTCVAGICTNDFAMPLESSIKGWPNFPGSYPRKVSDLAVRPASQHVHLVHMQTQGFLLHSSASGD